MKGTFGIDHKQGRHASSIRKRVMWVRRRVREDWQWAWLVNNSITLEETQRKMIVKEMRAAGLFARNTYWRDVNLDALFDLVRGK